MSNQLAPVSPSALSTAQPREITFDRLLMMQNLAPMIHASRLFGVGSPEQAVMIMLKGYELGLPFTASFELIHIIQGKPSLSPRGALAIIQASGLLADLKIEEQPGVCTVAMKRTNGTEYTTTFTLEDAKRAGIVNPDSGWQKYQANMLRWRSVGFCADVLFADVLGGMKRADEFGAMIDAQGNVVVGEVQDAR